MKMPVLYVLLAGLVMGCTHTQTVAPQDAQWREVNRRAEEKRATVIFVNDRTTAAKDLQLRPDSTSWLDPNTGTVQGAATSEVASISFKYRARGALEGLGVGLLFGAAGGAVLGSGGAEGEGWVSLSPMDRYRFFMRSLSVILPRSALSLWKATVRLL